MVGILQWPFGPVDVISLIATWRWFPVPPRYQHWCVFASPLGQGIPWLHVHLQSACGRVAKPLPISPTNLGGDFCIWLVGHFGCENSKMAIFFSETKAQYYNHVRNTQEKQSLLNRHNPWQVLPFASIPWWPLGQCWGGPYWGAMTDALLMDHIISKLGKGYSFFFFFFFGTFLDVFFQRILDPENRLKTQNRLLKKLQRKSRKNATVAFWETKWPPMWSQTQTWVFLVLVDPWKFTHIDMLLPFCTYFFLIQLETLECYILPVILPHLML